MPDLLFLSEASANPDLMIDWLIQREKTIPVFDSRFQRFSFPTIDAIRETLHENRSLSLQCDDPYVVTIGSLSTRWMLRGGFFMERRVI